MKKFHYTLDIEAKNVAMNVIAGTQEQADVLLAQNVDSLIISSGASVDKFHVTDLEVEELPYIVEPGGAGDPV